MVEQQKPKEEVDDFQRIKEIVDSVHPLIGQVKSDLAKANQSSE
jgi:hypothetical protein